ncbi:hypothetical protein BDV98DRAFT_606987 [Pterulicium gracile]|uniref:Large ribosomal subunit protein uL30m n=1 Tax=Pterulicium gracile TaxID=1884261 RepID=A0A5C3QAG4_9AGAR|nr:hypothetical protein BDV98DRAFT_606987 [Pterula gracilis]
MLSYVCTRRAALRSLQSSATWLRAAGISSTAKTDATAVPIPSASNAEPILPSTDLPASSFSSFAASPNPGLESLTSASSSSSQNTTTDPNAHTHYKITLTRSAISLGSAKQGTLKALGFHRRFQVVYHAHSPLIAGKILAVKELVHVENVTKGQVRTREEMRVERKASRGYEKTGERMRAQW